MKILAVVTDAFGGRGGIARACRDILSSIASLDHCRSIKVFPRAAPDPVSDLPSKVTQRTPRASKRLYSAEVLAAARGCDLVFCNHAYMAPLAFMAAKLASAKLVIQLHGIEAWESPRGLRRRALEAADALWCVSRFTRLRTLEHLDIAPEKVRVLNNTVDERFELGDRAGARAKYELGDAPTLLTVARLSPEERYKGHDLVIRSLGEIRNHVPGARYLIAGDGGDRERLERLAEVHCAPGTVQFLGRVPDEDLPELYRAVDLFLLPSTGEGFGIAFLEAMASGTPALGLRAGGAPDPLADGRLGACIESDDLIDTVSRLSSLPRGDALRRDTIRFFGRSVFDGQVEALVDRLCLARN